MIGQNAESFLLLPAHLVSDCRACSAVQSGFVLLVEWFHISLILVILWGLSTVLYFLFGYDDGSCVLFTLPHPSGSVLLRCCLL